VRRLLVKACEHTLRHHDASSQLLFVLVLLIVLDERAQRITSSVTSRLLPLFTAPNKMPN
jgi:hypothetical protein